MRIALILSMLAGILGVLIAWKMGFEWQMVRSLWEEVRGSLIRNPWALFLALAILPGFPVPSTALLIVAGLVWGKEPVMACVLCLAALFVNLSWTYWLAAGPARKFIERILISSVLTVPELPPGDHLKWILILKLTPGIPLFLQNYLLGFLRVPFRLYLLVSMLCNGVISTGVLLSSVGIGGGKLMPALSGILLVILGVVITRIIRSRLADRKNPVETVRSDG